jgi:hypothetical protein
MVGIFRTDLFKHLNGRTRSYFGAKPLSIGITSGARGQGERMRRIGIP